MYPTMEMRWFWPDRLPPVLDQWFQHNLESSPAAEREDWYLCLPDTADLGVKVRESKLEVKKRLIDRGLHSFGDRLEGRLEMWVKWSFESASAIDFYSPPGVWLSVKKSRQQQTYVITDDDRVEAIDTSADELTSLTQGCNLERVELSIFNQQWVSVCFEAFGSETSVEQTLERTIIHLLHQNNFPALTGKNSCGYPEWLKQLVKQHSVKPCP